MANSTENPGYPLGEPSFYESWLAPAELEEDAPSAYPAEPIISRSLTCVDKEVYSALENAAAGNGVLRLQIAALQQFIFALRLEAEQQGSLTPEAMDELYHHHIKENPHESEV
jgi:hypothetical protein